MIKPRANAVAGETMEKVNVEMLANLTNFEIMWELFSKRNEKGD